MKFEIVDVFKLAGLIMLLVVLAVVVALGWIQLVQPVKTVEGDMQTTARTAQPGEPGTEFPGEPVEIGPAPELPASDISLEVDTDTGIAYSPDGVEIYVLSADRTVWVPVVPQYMVDMLGDRVPSIDPSGNWVIVSSDGKTRYIWDSATAAWLPLDDELALESPGETAEPATEEAAETETEAAQAVPTQTPTQKGQDTGLPAATQAQGTTDEPASSEDQAAGSVAQPPVIPTATPGLPATHTLRGGEFAYCIARRYDVNPGELMSINGITYNTLLRGGTVLKIPQTGSPFPGRRALQSHPDTYTVQAGDSIYSIACAYGDVEPWAIAYANQLEAPYALTPGMALYIP